jgi:ribose 5-phosphate isomerase B
MTVAIGCDHAGYDLKLDIKSLLLKREIEYEDFGADSRDPSDYPDYAFAVARAVASGAFDRGILICGTGVGTSIAANKVKGIRAALVGDVYTARYSRSHNDANVLTLGARVIGVGLACEIVDEWLRTPFSNEARHCDRIALISRFEREGEHPAAEDQQGL